MFKIDAAEEKDGTFIRKVSVRQPKGERFREWDFKAEFKMLEQGAIDDIIYADEDEEAGSDERLLCDVLVGWKGIVDADGKEVPFSEEVRDRLLQKTWIRASLLQKYLEVMQGGTARARRRKNS